MTKLDRLFRVVNVGVAWTLCAIWLFALFGFGWLIDDRHGYGTVAWAGLASLGLLLQGGVLLAASLTKSSLASGWFAGAVAIAPLSHLLGSSINAPGCYPFFLLPTAAIVILGFREAIIAVARPENDTEFPTREPNESSAITRL